MVEVVSQEVRVRIANYYKIALCCLLAVISIEAYASEEMSQQRMAQDYMVPFYSGENLHYSIYYNWGFIWKKAAVGKLNVHTTSYNNETAYEMSLSCQTLKIVDKIMPVRDTLRAFTSLNIQPLFYNKITNEGSFSGKDFLLYRYEDDRYGADVMLERRNRPNADTTLWLDEQPYDMLSIFYYLRALDYEHTPMYMQYDIPIITGRRCVTMRIKYMGQTSVKLHSGNRYSAHKLYLSFFHDTNIKDEDEPIEVWLTDDDRKIPVKVSGKLPLGSLQAEYDENLSNY